MANRGDAAARLGWRAITLVIKWRRISRLPNGLGRISNIEHCAANEADLCAAKPIGGERERIDLLGGVSWLGKRLSGNEVMSRPHLGSLTYSER